MRFLFPLPQDGFRRRRVGVKAFSHHPSSSFIEMKLETLMGWFLSYRCGAAVGDGNALFCEDGKRCGKLKAYQKINILRKRVRFAETFTLVFTERKVNQMG